MKCRKKVFYTKKEAVKRIYEIQKENSKNRKPIRSYKCQNCGFFHLTSWSKKVKNKIEENNIIIKINKIEDEEEYWRNKKGW